MFEIDIRNRAAVMTHIDRWPEQIQAGASIGIENAAADLANEIRYRTPSKSGASRDAVYDRMRSKLVGEVGFEKSVKWYMEIVELYGSKPHLIVPRGRKGSRDLRRIGSYARKHKGQYDALSQMLGVVQSEDFLGVQSGALRRLRKSKETIGPFRGKFASTALLLNGDFRSIAMHPGIKPKRTLATTLASSQSAIVASIAAGIEQATSGDDDE